MRGTTQVTTYDVTGMTCGHCETAIRQEVGQLPGVQDITVSAASGRLVVTTIDDRDPNHGDAVLITNVIAAVGEAGYEAVRVR